MNILVVVAAETLLLFTRPGADGLLNIAVGILATNHETNLTGWVRRDCGVRVFGDREDLVAGLLEVGNQRKVKPLVFGCNGENVKPKPIPGSGGLGRDLVSPGTLISKISYKEKWKRENKGRKSAG